MKINSSYIDSIWRTTSVGIGPNSVRRSIYSFTNNATFTYDLTFSHGVGGSCDGLSPRMNLLIEGSCVFVDSALACSLTAPCYQLNTNLYKIIEVI